MPTVRLADGTNVPALGLGTWRMGETARTREREIAALRAGIDARHDAHRHRRNVRRRRRRRSARARRSPGAATSVRRQQGLSAQRGRASSAIAACERSLQRLRTDRLDLYLLHWRGRIPLAETVDAFERLRRDGKIVRWGVSNFDTADMDELLALTRRRAAALSTRCFTRRRARHRVFAAAAVPQALDCRHGVCAGRRGRVAAQSQRCSASLAPQAFTPAQLALAWLLRREHVISIPQTSDVAHVHENRAATAIALSSATHRCDRRGLSAAGSRRRDLP